ncbi:hypothetical protein OYT1_ch1156 [Ferriphaselus amnicola]|uniref:DUF883 domain-containing protein n=1 Tax=Ferriphaselus amnicola TaxID=1188319 RepID=A0A2Z6GB89_9PROT|nr:DUF883 family protein [Ferriphaselus amnicola]BBE50716.1 hypothetical protein OYT1_ch1156 [Ferriphaselus amnicola]
MDAKSSNLNAIIAPSKDRFMDEMRIVVADAEELLQATANQAGEGAAVARARIQKSLKVAKDRLIEAEAVVIERTRQAAKITDQYVHENPWKAIGISAGAGVIIGMLIARR